MTAFELIIIIYSIWGCWCGWKFIDGRWKVLEKPKIKILKLIVAFFVGFVIGLFKLLEHIFKLLDF